MGNMCVNDTTLSGCKVIGDSSEMSREEWLELRKIGLGGSDSAAIADLSTYASPLSVWLDKTGRSKPREETHRMSLGRIIEAGIFPVLPDIVSGVQAVPYKKILQSIHQPLFFANIDGLCWDSEDRKGVFEVKSIYQDSEWKGGVPRRFYVQVQHYLYVTGLSYAIIIGVGAFGVYPFRVERDEEAILSLIERGLTFWATFVEADVAPAPSGVEAEDDWLNEQIGKSDTAAVLEEDMVGEYSALGRAISDMEKRRKALQSNIKAGLGSSSYGVAGKYAVTVQVSQRSGYTVAPTTITSLRIKEVL